MVKPFLMGSDSAENYLDIGLKILREKGTALDAIEQTCRAVESNPDDHGVGLGGIPNLAGEVTLDASIMCGRTLGAGSVAHIKNYLHVITLARKVMDDSPHVLLVGDGAELFAEYNGFKKTKLLTPYAEEFYNAFKEKRLHELGPEYDQDKGYLREDEQDYDTGTWFNLLEPHMRGTVNVMAMDINQNIATAVTTSGTYLKLPGRVGDSPIIGAGNYCDNRYGAACCTGTGELAIRNGTARAVVAYMKMGMGPTEACEESMKEIQEIVEIPTMNVIAFNRDGETGGASTYREILYYYMDHDSVKVENRKGAWVKK
ncbi:N(4)-(beta-N-acetylglucosaminyl)-L-asparaginase [Candidatus Bathyarchaeota archaeon]|jgi:L-asparaginase / beta-aspartyl-peptidase|nr:N(4)-(beta-N-acetylglucosaminyl)-L-asparaginase [Candidatus Bathyarchaeota archaeon]MBT4319771.1 N(4)-(beta-N-acetylglucosaminyl)-L-asparaginase [Candidatus Bathyarchaeota archaeon]MBT4424764.1 N(4)-(beta-N-acetylglucosaminyl)-L-asparaginase [Candidatus Bathyarchaeota archaeon]MBT5642306.1 N(4)-(beta-N-acetylglucosaminyl)-L-asparaginase [Candidatus Bathyarchaeota archaeon]MBT7188252.1 N(4)-(beta-N-acetylglucosaminyl)-L-asparaginase [Candidatus Bathyarchaeota archaeon]